MTLVNPHPGMKIIACPMCGGSGHMPHFAMRGALFQFKPYEEECEECLGEGSVEIEDEDYSDE